MDTATVKELAAIMRDCGLSRLDVTDGATRITLEKGAVKSAPDNMTESADVTPQAAENSNIAYVKSPIVGTVYLSPKPGEAEYVKVGDRVKAGDILCAVEAMKMFNELNSPCDGTVKEIFIKNGQPAGYGLKLFAIEKD